jgi:hypothetical protein
MPIKCGSRTEATHLSHENDGINYEQLSK